MSETEPTSLRPRTLDFALTAIETNGALPNTPTADHLGHQMMRSATTVGAHYREASRARSTAEFTSKIEVAIQELEETRYWLELLEHAHIGEDDQLQTLTSESSELIAIFTTIVKKTKRLQGA
jgi:four helix bundle protein